MSTDRPQLWDDIPALRDKEPTVDTPETPLGVDPTDPHHEFMFTDGDYEPVLIAAEIQRGVEDLPPTAATFKLDRVLDRDVPRSAIPVEIVELTGAWPVPEAYTQGQNGQKYVNPNYDDARLYSEVVTKCACGAVMIRQESIRGEGVVPGEHEHTDDCPKDFRLHARARLAEQRRRVVKRGLYLGHSIRAMQDRLGLSRDSLGEEAKELGISPISEIKERGRQVLARTWARLAREYSPSVIGDAYGCHGQKIRRYINERTGVTGSELAEHRRNS